MTHPKYVPLAITPMWSTIVDELVELVDLVPEDKMDWSPKPELWNFKGILIHIILGPRFLMNNVLQEQSDPAKLAADVMAQAQTKEEIKEQLRISWVCLEPFLQSEELLAREYDVGDFAGVPGRLSGYWLAFGQLEHHLHHRADIYHYLGLLGVPHEEPDVVARKLREG